MKKSLLFSFFIIVFTYSYCNVFAEQNSELFSLTARAGLSYNIFSADFMSFKGTPDCGPYKSGHGLGPAFLIGGNIPLNNTFALGLNIGLFNRSGNLTKDNSYPVYNAKTDEIINFSSKNKLEAKLNYIEFMPNISMDLFNLNTFREIVGLRFAIPMKKDFTLTEEINSPTDYVFEENGKNSRTIADGKIPNASSLLLGITFGFENMLKIGSNTFFTQALSFDYNVSDFSSDANWNLALGARLELGIRFSFVEPEKRVVLPLPPTPEPVKEIVKLVPELNLDIISFSNSILNKGSELRATAPLVNAVFFDRGQSDIPSKYLISNDIRNIDLFSYDGLEIHKYVLPRIAAIIKNNPNSKVLLEAATSGSSLEPEGIELAKKRAESVKNALINLGVDHNKIETKAFVSPKNPSNQEYAQGADENQRVDIILINAKLQEYVSSETFAELSTKATVKTELKNLDNNSDVYLKFNLGNKQFKIAESKMQTFDLSQRFDSLNSNFILNAELTNGTLSAKSSKKIDLSTSQKINTALDLDKFEAVIRFDYNSSKLTDENKELISQLCEILPEHSKIIIFGSADALGTQESNMKLANERAKETEAYVKKVAGRKFTIETSTDSKKFDENSPEGRFLNRSIKIKVSK